MQTGRPDREFHFTDDNFKTIKSLIYECAGINLADTKRDMVYSRLSRRLRANNLTTFQQYLELIKDADSFEHQEFVNSLTTNLTSFFRESHHFDILKEYFANHPEKRHFRIWCCAASTGEEPYSIAMSAVEYFERFDAPVEIFASDLDTKVLEKAQRGIYSSDRVERLQEQRLKTFFFRGKGDNSGLVKVKSELKDLIHFFNLNLLSDSWPFDQSFDIIFCRNVMIYFDKPTQYKVLKKFAPYLKNDGLLFAGHSESFTHATDIFKLRKHTVYEKAQSQ